MFEPSLTSTLNQYSAKLVKDVGVKDRSTPFGGPQTLFEQGCRSLKITALESNRGSPEEGARQSIGAIQSAAERLYLGAQRFGPLVGSTASESLKDKWT